jgi:hypothetical protein
MKWYVVYFKFQKSGEKKPGPVSHYKLQARSLQEAREMAKRYANYPGIEIVNVEEA